jgi:multiple sugar transport system substrate-binding protein
MLHAFTRRLLLAALFGLLAAPALAQAPALPQQCQSVQLQYWNPFTGPDGPYMGQLVDGFNAANPNIQVTMNTLPEYGTQLTTAAASGTLPDVAVIWADQVATYAYRNVFRPMDDVVAQLGLSGEDFPEAVWAAGEVNGQRYAVPLDIHPLVMFYNQDLLEAAGIEGVPQTREEFEAAAEAITGGRDYGFMITTGFPIEQIFRSLLHQFGGSEFNEDGTEATWNSEAGVRALEWMKSAQERFSEANLEVDSELNAFKAGGAGMIWNGIWQTTNVTGDAVMFESGATAFPQIGDQPAVWAGSHQLALPVKPQADECRDAAAAVFIRYLLDNSLEWSRAGQIPASNAVRESAEFQELTPQAQIAPSADFAIFPPSVPGITDAFAALGEAVGSIMSGTATDIQATLDASVQRANELLAQNRSTYGTAP